MILLCAAALVFPFSVAVTNIFLGAALALGLVSGVWWQGARECWSNHRLLSIIFCAYMVLLLLGLLWSLDLKWGLHVLGRHWFWLLLPIVVSISLDKKWRDLFLLSLSAGLAVNLVYCVLQMFGYVEVTTGGSNAENATGHIGHIGFGFVYGVWATWLLHLGLLWSGTQRLIVWGLAAWSYVMVFAAQGRSGYLIAVILMLSVCLKWVVDSRSWRIAVMFVAMAVLMLFVIALGSGKERLHGTWLAFTQTQYEAGLDWRDSSDNAILATQERFQMWKTSINIYLDNPVLGVGTGGFPVALDKMIAERRSASRSTAHPHNQYLLNLTRWGPLGLLLLCSLLYFWMREGWRMDWRELPMAPLIFLPALALAVHALSSTSVEEHFSAILAVLLLGTGLAGNRIQNEKGDCECN
ncbi:O-antigen ligase [Mariprofundus aestuarium]|uniref:O-antigen ligase n=2 Tax=Mariprofundus aestuarium TaxID=1921086 RepID=A0A2K8KZ22_MARES|nr:O-antigen ligase [Mariprofundus aestuarium]